MTEPRITVVITSHQRPEFLKSAFQSCLAAGINRIVITATGVGDRMHQVIRECQCLLPWTIAISESGDSGSNEAWLRGVQACDTEWVQLLHDDDLLLPDYLKMTAALEGMEFVCWDGLTHGTHSGLCRTLQISHGLKRCGDLERDLMTQRHSPSPVAGCFKREHLLNVLTHCRKLGPEFIFKGKLLVGNDLLIWLMASKLDGSFIYLQTPLVSFCGHPGSATIISDSEGDSIMAYYNRAREHFKSMEIPQ